jgi:ATP-dependent protease HslVU (ClpYQ) peptidase subunit
MIPVPPAIEGRLLQCICYTTNTPYVEVQFLKRENDFITLQCYNQDYLWPNAGVGGNGGGRQYHSGGANADTALRNRTVLGANDVVIRSLNISVECT